MDNDIERIRDVCLDRAVRQVHTALQDTTREPSEALLRGVCMDGGESAGMPGIEKLQKIEGFTAASRLPSGRRESRIGFDSEMSSPRRRAIFLTATIRDRSPKDTPGTC